MDFSILKNYYFMRCFSCKEYRDDFNSGKKVYVNSMQYFHEHEDDFQRDFEGGVFAQGPGEKGGILLCKNSITAEMAIKKVSMKQFTSDDMFIETKNAKLFINGYIFCMTIIPKQYLEIRAKELVFNRNKDISSSFYYLLNQYAKKNKYAFFSFYDAEPFMERFCTQMIQRGYSLSCGRVAYENLSQEQRSKYYDQGDIAKLVFTKDKRFHYQNEFRIFIQCPSGNTTDHIEESGIDMSSAVLKDLVYLSPEYAKELGWKK